MLGKWTQCLRSHRNREDYRAQNIRNQRKIDDLEAENRRLRDSETKSKERRDYA